VSTTLGSGTLRFTVTCKTEGCPNARPWRIVGDNVPAMYGPYQCVRCERVMSITEGWAA
jgi:hypothetical protein